MKSKLTIPNRMYELLDKFGFDNKIYVSESYNKLIKSNNAYIEDIDINCRGHIIDRTTNRVESGSIGRIISIDTNNLEVQYILNNEYKVYMIILLPLFQFNIILNRMEIIDIYLRKS